MINIVIPMAGSGSRFKLAGYEDPKPFIKINDKMMIEHVLDGLNVKNANYTLIIQEDFRNNYKENLDYIKEKYNVSFICVNKLTQGASCTALMARKIIDNNVPVIFADCDNIFNNKVINTFIDDTLSKNIDGALLTFNTNESCFSFAKVNNNGLLIETKEKEVISNHAITGIYMFNKGSYFVDCAVEMLIYGDKIKNEYYMSNVYNYAVKQFLKIGIFDIKQEDWDCVGTPQQLDVFLKKL